jgi:DNA-binding transcriptional ArsR family regulator
MHAFDVLGDPVRRRILELLGEGEHSSGEVVSVVEREFGISQAAVSQHLKVLRESGFARVRVDRARRIYTIDARFDGTAMLLTNSKKRVTCTIEYGIDDSLISFSCAIFARK